MIGLSPPTRPCSSQTSKELVARAIHRHGARFPGELLESEPRTTFPTIGTAHHPGAGAPPHHRTCTREIRRQQGRRGPPARNPSPAAAREAEGAGSRMVITPRAPGPPSPIAHSRPDPIVSPGGTVRPANRRSDAFRGGTKGEPGRVLNLARSRRRRHLTAGWSSRGHTRIGVGSRRRASETWLADVTSANAALDEKFMSP